ncbi:ATP-binding protein [Embleya sp. NBC_00888]|uniref:ATP-binding protein n=1 Tax=Embleya sp. NBC_00888 TaxID=2975960 RepID=UPI00386E83B6|nr:ATP-binding protein [Embleya sp. NBC_00888]
MKPEISPIRLAPSTADFVRRFASTTFGARAARLVAMEQLAAWGRPQESDASRTVALLVAELAANAVIHGRGSDHGFELRLAIESAWPGPATLRVEVSDRHDGMPTFYSTLPVDTAESGRGLLLVDALATSRGVERRHPTGKTIWAELELPALANPTSY